MNNLYHPRESDEGSGPSKAWLVCARCGRASRRRLSAECEGVLANVEWEDDVSQDRRDVVRGLPLYKQGASHGENAVKLSSNENPFEPLPSVVEAVTRTLRRFNRYPSMSAEEVRSTIAGHFGVDVSQVAVGAGSTEVASQLMHAFAGAGDEIIFPWRSFEAYPILTKVAGATPIQVPLTVDLRHDLDAPWPTRSPILPA